MSHATFALLDAARPSVYRRSLIGSRAAGARGNREPGANPGLSRSGEWERQPAISTDPHGLGSAGQ